MKKINVKQQQLQRRIKREIQKLKDEKLWKVSGDIPEDDTLLLDGFKFTLEITNDYDDLDFDSKSFSIEVLSTYPETAPVITYPNDLKQIPLIDKWTCNCKYVYISLNV